MRTLIAVMTLALLATACAGDDDTAASDVTTTAAPTTAAPTTEAPTTTAPTSTQPPTASEHTLAVSPSDLGDILTDGDGNTLYLFLPDAQGESVCYDQCEAAWPPLVGDVSAGEGIDGALLGSVARTDGSQQATYNGWPLYYFASDTAAGDINGQGINDVWWVVDASGDAVK